MRILEDTTPILIIFASFFWRILDIKRKFKLKILFYFEKLFEVRYFMKNV